MKRIVFFGLFLLLNLSVFGAGKRVVIFNPIGEGISEDEQNWLPSSVRRKLESHFNDYTPYQIVDVQNEKEIKEIQKKAESYSYDQETSIELGKLVSAEIGIFSSITKAGNKYMLSVNVTNLTTGIRSSSVTSDMVSDSFSLFDGPSCSVNKVFVKLCDDLGINLSSVDKFVLLKGQSLTDSEQITMTQEEVSKYERKQLELDKQLKEISVSADLDSETKKAKIEAEKALAEQQALIAKERLERLTIQQEMLIKDQEQQKKRTAEQREKIEKAAAEAERTAAMIRQTKIENLSVDGQISIIEAKKQALVDIRNSVSNQEKLIIQLANEDYKVQTAVIDNEPLRNGETDSNGNILPAIKQKRNEKKKVIKQEIEARANADIDVIQTKTLAQENALYKDIQNDRNKLKVRRTVSSLQDDRILSIGNYAGEKFEWEASASIYINDVKIFSQNANISYKSVSGKQPVLPTDRNEKLWNEYLDTVDLYDYMFRRNVPAVSLEIDYSVEAMPDNLPSMYKLVIYEFRFVDTVTGKTVQSITPARTTYRFTSTPVVDISSERNTASADEVRELPSVNTNVKSVSEKTVKQKKEKSSKTDLKYSQKNGNGNRLNLGGMIGFAGDYQDRYGYETGISLEGYLSYPLTPYLFVQGDIGVMTVPSYFGDYVCYDDNGKAGNDISSALFTCSLDAGLNIRLGSMNKAPNLFTYAGIGFMTDDNLYRRNTRKPESLFFSKYAFGMDIPLSNASCITLEYDLMNASGLGNSQSFKIGYAISIPD